MPVTFRSYFPSHPLLRKYVHYFYFDTAVENDFYRQYSFFPHIKTTLSFYRHAHLTQEGDTIKISGHPGAPLLKVLTRQHTVKTIVQQGRIEKTGIVFYPLGLNHFISGSYGALAKQEVQAFTDAGQQWNDTLALCFSLADDSARVAALEQLLQALYRPQAYDHLYAVIAALSEPGNLLSIDDISHQYGLSHRSLNREFNKHLGLSPELFRMITRFRYTVEQKLNGDNKENLTSLTYKAGYSDQSYMVRCFKKLTGKTPLQFFKSGTHLGMADTFWQIAQ